MYRNFSMVNLKKVVRSDFLPSNVYGVLVTAITITYLYSVLISLLLYFSASSLFHPIPPSLPKPLSIKPNQTQTTKSTQSNPINPNQTKSNTNQRNRINQ